MSIERIDVSHHQLPLDPPFPASWDPEPRTRFPVTIVQVRDSSGAVGIGSGGPVLGLADAAALFVGCDPLDLDRHDRVLANLSFHGDRMWPLGIALWDLAGKLTQRPIYEMVGGRRNRVRAYASCGVHRSPAETVEMAERFVAAGFPALKLRFGRHALADDIAVVAHARAAVGPGVKLMVDCNQGWRMPWDVRPAWRFDLASEVARRLEALDVYWMEEPLHRADYSGMRRLRATTSVRIAGGEMNREISEFHILLESACLDVYQPDVALTGGFTGLKALIPQIESRGAVFTPHTWGNGIVVAANCHLAAGAAEAPFVEFPLDPPEWTLDRRDYALAVPLQVDAEGWIELGDAPGLGVELDMERLAATATDSAAFT